MKAISIAPKVHPLPKNRHKVPHIGSKIQKSSLSSAMFYFEVYLFLKETYAPIGYTKSHVDRFAEPIISTFISFAGSVL